MTLTLRTFLLGSMTLSLGACVGLGSQTGDEETGTTARPATCPPPDLFDSALCLCEDFDEVGALQIVEGPSGIGSVGVNGFTRWVNQTVAVGDWIAYAGFEAVTDTMLAGSLKSEGDAHWVGLLDIGTDLAVGGDVSGVGQLSVGGMLSVAGTEQLLGPSDIGGRTEYQPLAGPPCPCDTDSFFDVTEAVAAARDQNDNAGAGLPTRLAEVGETELRLETGTYFFEDADTVGRTRFVIAGQVALYVEGEIDAVGVESFELESGATLDLFVSGGIRTVGVLNAGNASDPEAFRLYLGGTGSVLLSVGVQSFYGNIYAPEAAIAWVGDTEVVGSLFGRTLDGVGELTIGYGAPAQVDPPSCEDPEDPDEGQEDPDQDDPEEPDSDDPDSDDPGDGGGDDTGGVD